MKCRKALLSEEEILDKVNKVSKRASETREQTLHMLARTEPNTYDKHKHLSYSLHRGFCTSVLFIILVSVVLGSIPFKRNQFCSHVQLLLWCIKLLFLLSAQCVFGSKTNAIHCVPIALFHDLRWFAVMKKGEGLGALVNYAGIE